MFPHLAAFLLRAAVSAGVLMLSVGWVSPGNPRNTFLRALVVSLFLSVAWFLTLSRFLWFLLIPWLLYAAIWLATVMGAYQLRFFQSLLLAVVLTLLSYLVGLLFGVETL